jgi:predicted metalloenzyme YecM
MTQTWAYSYDLLLLSVSSSILTSETSVEGQGWNISSNAVFSTALTSFTGIGSFLYENLVNTAILILFNLLFPYALLPHWYFVNIN